MPANKAPQSLEAAVLTVLERFTLPSTVRKILETAYYASDHFNESQESLFNKSCLNKLSFVKII